MEKKQPIHRMKEYFVKRRHEREQHEAKLFGVPDGLQPHELEEHFLGAADKLREDRDEAAVSDDIDSQARNYLEANGIHEADDSEIFDKNYHLIRHVAYHNADRWSEHEDAIDKTPAQYVIDDLNARYVEPAREASHRAMEDHGESIDDLKKQSTQLAEKYGERLAKRADKAGLFERSGGLDTAKQEFEDMTAALATEMMVENEASGALSDDELNEAIATFVDSQTNTFVERMEQYRLQKSANRNRVTRFVTEKWASWTPHAPATTEAASLLSWKGVKQVGRNIAESYKKENLKGTLAKNAVTAMGGAALATVLSPVAAVGAVGGAAAFFGARAARVAAVQKMNSMAGAEKLAAAQRSDIEHRIAEARATYMSDTEGMFTKLSRFDSDIAEAEAAGDLDKVAELREEQETLRSSSRSLHEIIADLTAERAASYRSDNQKRLVAGTALAMVFGGVGAGLASHFNLGGNLGPLQGARDNVKEAVDASVARVEGVFSTGNDLADGHVIAGSSTSGPEGGTTSGHEGGMLSGAASGEDELPLKNLPIVDTPQLPETDTNLELSNALFIVEQGNGLTHEIMQTAEAHGVTLTDQEAFEIHQRLVDQVGRDYIDLTGVDNDVYSMGNGKYDIGISAPGTAHWDPKAAALLQQELVDRGAHFSGATEAVVQNTDSDSAGTAQPDNDPAATTVESPSSQRTLEWELRHDSDELAGQAGTAESLSPSNERTPEWELRHDSDESVGQIVTTESLPPSTEKSLEWYREHDVDEAAGQSSESDGVDDNDGVINLPRLSDLPDTDRGMDTSTVIPENGYPDQTSRSWIILREDPNRIRDMINGDRIVEINSNPDLQGALEYIKKDIGDMKYSGTDTPIIERIGNTSGGDRWVINSMPEGGRLPGRVIDSLSKYFEGLPAKTP